MNEIDEAVTDRRTRKLPRSEWPENYPWVRDRNDRIKSFESPSGTFQARWGREPWERLYTGVSRDHFSIVIYAEGARIGYARGREWKISSRADYGDLLDCMEFEDVDAHSMCVALRSTWWHFPAHVSDHGTIVSIDRVFMEPNSAVPGAWATAAKWFIEEQTRYAVLMIQAHPFMRTDMRGSPAWKSRRKAMMRYYAGLFDARQCSGESGKIGWLVAIRPSLADAMPSMKTGRSKHVRCRTRS